MAIRMRRGNEADLDKTKLVSGEIAVSVDADIVRVSKGNGETIDLATQDDLRNIIKLDGGVTIEENTLVISPEEETTEEQGTPVDIDKISIDGGETLNPIKDSTARTNITSVSGRVTAIENSVGANNGIAPLDSTGRVPSSNLPSYVDDVIEGYYKVADGKFYKESTYTTEITPESGKIYVSIDTNKEYRWGGSTYVEIASALALGETQGTAYEGSKGKANADNIADIQSVIPAKASTSNMLATMEDVGGSGGEAVWGGITGTLSDQTDLAEALNSKADYNGVEALIKTTVGFATKNILNCDIASGEHTKNGLTIYVTRYVNGQIASISVNGTATAKTYIEVASSVPEIVANAYILNGCPSGGSSSSYGLMIEGSYGSEFTDYGDGVLIQRGVVNGKVYIVIANGYTANNLYFYPMIRDKNVADDTYEGYRENVKSLIDKKADASDVNNKVSESLLKDTVGWIGKNLDNPFKIDKNTSTDYTKTDKGYSVFTSASVAYGKVFLWYSDLPKNTDLTLTVNADYTSGTGKVVVDGTNDTLANRTFIKGTNTFTADTEVELTFNTGSYKYILVTLQVTDTTSASGNILYDEYMLRKASVIDPTYEPYHDNVDLTIDKKAELLDKDTVGWIGKNKVSSIFINAVQPIYETVLFGEIDNLQPDTDYILSFDTTDSGTAYYTNENIFTSDSTVTTNGGTTSVQVRTKSALDKSAANQYTVGRGWRLLKNRNAQSITPNFANVMLRKADISDATYESYHPSVEQTLRDAEVIEGKNLLDIPESVVNLTANGGTFAVNRNNNGDVTSIVVNGTFTSNTTLNLVNNLVLNRDLFLSGAPQTGSSSTYLLAAHDGTRYYEDKGNGVTLPSGTYRIFIVCYNGYTANNLTFKPMLCTKEEWDKSQAFEPYYIPLKDSKFDRSEQRVLGAKNRLEIPRSVVTTTHNNVTFTVYRDSNGNVEKINVNGTSPNDNYGQLLLSKYSYGNTNPLLPKERVRFSLEGATSGLHFCIGKGNSYVSNSDASNSVVLNGDDFSWVYIRLDAGKSANVDIYPMIVEASDPDTTYAPYAMTNREITEKVSELDAGHFFGGNFPFYMKRYTLSANKSLRITGASSYQNYFIMGDSQLFFIVQNSPTNSFINSLSEKSTGITPTITHVEDKIVKLNNAQSYGLGLIIISMSDFDAETVTT